MKTILCFGDSNTFGTNPSGGRWPREIRWPGRLQQLLGNEFYVIEEGCGGRTTVWEDNLELYRNGRSFLPVALATHKPLDLVIIMLGTNDFKSRFRVLPCDIAEGIRQLAELVQNFTYGPYYTVPQILLVSPIVIGEGIENSIMTGFTSDAAVLSRKLAPLVQKAAKRQDCFYLNAAEYAGPSAVDQLHMEREDHIRLAEAMASKVRTIL